MRSSCEPRRRSSENETETIDQMTTTTSQNRHPLSEVHSNENEVQQQQLRAQTTQF